MLLRPYQTRLVSRAVKALDEYGNTLAVAPTGAGKCLGKGTPVLMYGGNIKPVEDVVVGDIVMGPDSNPRLVTSLARGREEMYAIVPVKGDSYIVNKSHILSLVISGNDAVSGYAPGSIVNMDVLTYLRQNKTFKHCAKGWRTGVDFHCFGKGIKHIIPPYILGVWLGDGSNYNQGISNPDSEIINEIYKYGEAVGLDVREETTQSCPNYFITSRERKPFTNIFCAGIRSLGLFHNKHIPFSYKIASRKDRLEILAGLLDTDGHLSNGGFDYISKDKKLSEDVAFIARSVGLAAYVAESMKKAQGWDEPRMYYRVSISGDCSIIPCRVKRKQSPERRQVKNVLRTGIDVEYVGIGDYFGFTLAGPDRLFLLGDFTVTHNTIMLASLVKDVAPKKALVLQHRIELVQQNSEKFLRVNPKASVSRFDAGQKDWDASAVFGMVQTLSRRGNLKTIPKLDLLIVDEAHHAVAPTYRSVIDRVKDRNPKCLVAGFTATPARGDGKGLRPVFDNCCDQILLQELIRLGFLVRPRTFVKSTKEVEEALKNVRRKGDEYDMDEVEAIMNKPVLNAYVIREWKEAAGERKTIVFCSTIHHATDVCKCFRSMGVNAAVVSGETSASERESLLHDFDKGDLQVLVNCAVLTEGYDSQPVSCVVLLRPCSYKSTMLQMIGRGLRVVDAEQYPGVEKTDCIVLDFGTSLATHGNFDMAPRMDDKEKGEAPVKECKGCGAIIPASVMECPICGEGLENPGFVPTEYDLEDVRMIEIEIIESSPFRWVDLFGSGRVMMASGFKAWVCVASPDGEHWTALGRTKDGPPLVVSLAKGEKAQCLSKADDFLRCNEDDDAAKKSKRWLNDAASPKQVELLERAGFDVGFGGFGFTKYSAACNLNFVWNKWRIEQAIGI